MGLCMVSPKGFGASMKALTLALVLGDSTAAIGVLGESVAKRKSPPSVHRHSGERGLGLDRGPERVI